MSVGLETRLLGSGDVDALCALFARVFGHQIDPHQWRWKYSDPALAGSANIGLFVGGVLSGHAGAIVLPGVHRGRAVTMAQACDVMLAPEVRGALGRNGAYPRLLRSLAEFLQEAYPDGLYYGFPGERPFRLGERLGFYRRIGPIVEYSVPANCHPVFALRLGVLQWDDSRLDSLWERCKDSFDDCRVVRDRRYLSWRYARKPGADYILLGVRGWRGMHGWVVVRLTGGRIEIVDRLLEAGRLKAVIQAVGAWGRRSGAQRVTWWQEKRPEWAGSVLEAHETGIVGGVMCASAPAFAHVAPVWQPGDTDVR